MMSDPIQQQQPLQSIQLCPLGTFLLGPHTESHEALDDPPVLPPGPGAGAGLSSPQPTTPAATEDAPAMTTT